MIPLSPDLHAAYLHDESQFAGAASFIAFPATPDALLAEILAARDRNLPITPQGARTALTGAGVPVTPHGLLLSCERLAGVTPLPPLPDGTPLLRVLPGTRLADLRAACPPGWFFPTDPTEPSATIGGMISTNASGARSFRYGPVRPHVRALTLIPPYHPDLPPSPFVLRRTLPPPRPPVKTAAGYCLDSPDPIDLHIGAEGTLAIIADATLALTPVPDARAALFILVPDAPDLPLPALRALSDIAAIEYFDAPSLALLHAHGHLAPLLPHAPPDDSAALCIEFHSASPAAAESAAAATYDLLTSALSLPLPDATLLATTPRELDALRAFRHALPETVNAIVAENKRRTSALTKLATDFAVPPDALPDLLRTYRADLRDARIPYVTFGHIGDAHLHLNLLPDRPELLPAARALIRRWAARVTALGGSLSAEHGIGKLKRPLFLDHTPADRIARLAAIKNTYDPEHLLNPGTLLP